MPLGVRRYRRRFPAAGFFGNSTILMDPLRARRLSSRLVRPSATPRRWASARWLRGRPAPRGLSRCVVIFVGPGGGGAWEGGVGETARAARGGGGRPLAQGAALT